MTTLHDCVGVYTVTQSLLHEYLAVWCMWWNSVTGLLSTWEREKVDWVMKLSVIVRGNWSQCLCLHFQWWTTAQKHTSTGQLYVHTLACWNISWVWRNMCHLETVLPLRKVLVVSFPEGTRRWGTGTGGMVVWEGTGGGVVTTVREEGSKWLLGTGNVHASHV